MIPIHQNKTEAPPVSPTEASSLRALRTGRLSSEERTALREHLYSVVQATPAPVSPTIFSTWQTLFLRQAWAGAALAVVFVLTGSFGIARAAETALPGETLYPFKVRVNEPVVGWLQRDRESRAAWERERAQRRLAEAEKLLESGELSDREKSSIDELLTEHRRTLGKYADDSDEDFLFSANQRGRRAKIEIEDKNGERRYSVVRGDDDDDRSGEEGENDRLDDDEEEGRSGSGSGDDDASDQSERADDVRSSGRGSSIERGSSSGWSGSGKATADNERETPSGSSGTSSSSGDDTDDDEKEKDEEKEEEDKDTDEDNDEDDGDEDPDEEEEDNSGSGGGHDGNE